MPIVKILLGSLMEEPRMIDLEVENLGETREEAIKEALGRYLAIASSRINLIDPQECPRYLEEGETATEDYGAFIDGDEDEVYEIPIFAE